MGMLIVGYLAFNCWLISDCFGCLTVFRWLSSSCQIFILFIFSWELLGKIMLILFEYVC